MSYDINWVSKCLASSKKTSAQELSTAQVDQFLNKLSKTREQWQVEQATLAIRIYQYFVKNKQQPASFDAVDDKHQWRFVAKEMKIMLRLKQRSLPTERSYLNWLWRFYTLVKGQSPFRLDSTHVKNFLTHQAIDRRVSTSTQNPAFNALLFFFGYVLEKDIEYLNDVVRAPRSRRLPMVLNQSEIAKLFNHLTGVHHIMAEVFYGGGLRRNECAKLRVKGIDHENNLISVIGGKGNKDRKTLLAKDIKDALIDHLEKSRKI